MLSVPARRSHAYWQVLLREEPAWRVHVVELKEKLEQTEQQSQAYRESMRRQSVDRCTTTGSVVWLVARSSLQSDRDLIRRQRYLRSRARDTAEMSQLFGTKLHMHDFVKIPNKPSAHEREGTGSCEYYQPAAIVEELAKRALWQFGRRGADGREPRHLRPSALCVLSQPVLTGKHGAASSDEQTANASTMTTPVNSPRRPPHLSRLSSGQTNSSTEGEAPSDDGALTAATKPGSFKLKILSEPPLVTEWFEPHMRSLHGSSHVLTELHSLHKKLVRLREWRAGQAVPPPGHCIEVSSQARTHDQPHATPPAPALPR
jgi:hypothetical protein